MPSSTDEQPVDQAESDTESEPDSAPQSNLDTSDVQVYGAECQCSCDEGVATTIATDVLVFAIANSWSTLIATRERRQLSHTAPSELPDGELLYTVIMSVPEGVAFGVVGGLVFAIVFGLEEGGLLFWRKSGAQKRAA